MKNKKICIAISILLVATLCLLGFSACSDSTGDAYTIRVGASSTPHAEILEQVKTVLAEWGWTLEVTVFSDYILPNMALDGGELDANYFQHITYLNNFNSEHGTKLASVFAVHYEPLGIYAGTQSRLADINSDSTVAIPYDTTNCARALLLLEEQGLLTLASGAGINATKEDIVDSQSTIKKANVTQLEALLISQAISEKSIVVLNGNYAQQANLSVNDALAVESTTGTASEAYANVIATKEDNKAHPKTLALVKALRSQAILDFIAYKFVDGSVQAVFSL